MIRARVSAPGAVLVVALALVAAGCASGGGADAGSTPIPVDVESRLDGLDEAVAGWRTAQDLADAHRNAEAARNLIVGPDGPFYGDADGDGAIEGASDIGLLPGLGGEPGLAQPPVNPCVERDVLGGAWDDPEGRWDEFSATLAEWAPGNNTMPRLPSHPQRVVGWATLTLGSHSLDDAREYAGHAQLHVDITRSAYAACPG